MLCFRFHEVDENYFRECRLAGAAAVEVLTVAGTCERICGTRYLQAGTSITAAVVDGQLEVTYQGAVLRTVAMKGSVIFVLIVSVLGELTASGDPFDIRLWRLNRRGVRHDQCQVFCDV
ncbi:hypothetical protein CCUG60884_00244 [Mycobacteroides salmoniphilum]|uniref:Uncharacterized protein n=1 Tax=Mycobacteroides salmoniphilum TaxID=404941 RepID=A0A4R8SZZ8_9MYCO|nr:hypothetical protein CCUG60884_00244 [Mycobacteroides salmoniphilum]